MIRRLRLTTKIIIFLIFAVIITLIIKINENSNITTSTSKNIFYSNIKKIQEKANRISDCLVSANVPDDVKDKLKPLEDELNKFLKTYNVGFKYQEKTLDYEISYRSDVIFYGASLIKLVDANYLLDNDVDLNITKKYENKYKMAYSSGVSTYKIGDDISLKDLMNYAISVSDNSAHLMLIDYIGFNKLQDYGKSLGGKVILQGGDLFGNQTADDMIIYLNKSYELINSKENGLLLKEALLNDEVNYLNFDNIKFGHKYGSHSYFFHDVGIYFSDNPYLIAVLTTSDSKKSIVTEISRKVYNIHTTLLEEKNNYCYNIVK